MASTMIQRSVAQQLHSSWPAAVPLPVARRQRFWLRQPGSVAAPRPWSAAPYVCDHQTRVVYAAVLDAPVSNDDPQQEQQQEDTPFGLPLPDARHQRPIDFKSVKQLRTEANNAAKNKELMNIQAGQNGITQTFLSACMDILMKHRLVRVRLGDGSGLDRDETAKALEQLLDCVCVHQIGFTVTLYRQTGLPRPSNCPPNAVPHPESAAAVQTASEGSNAEVSKSKASKGQKTASKGAGRGKARNTSQASSQPEFQVL